MSESTTKTAKPTAAQLARGAVEQASALDARMDGIDVRLDGFEASFGENAAKLDSVLDALAGMSAKNRPTAPMSYVDVAEIGEEAESDAEFADGEDRKLVMPNTDLSDPELRKTLDLDMFLREMIEIEVSSPSEEQADQVFEIGVNDRKYIFRRGDAYTVPRFIVETMARARPATYRNEEYIDRDGVKKVRWPQQRGLRYQFTVLHDPSGRKGLDWLKDVLRQP